MEASPDLPPVGLKFQEMRTNNKLGIRTPTRLPDDMINEIIERLPTISNFRFKCVSKQWFSLNFEALKLKSQTHTSSGIFYVTYKGESDTGAKYVKTSHNDDSCIDGILSFLPEHRYIKIHDSCNGLLLCEGRDTQFPPTNNSNQTLYLYVCNPATRKFVEIPCIFMKTVPLAILDFNPLVSVHFNVIIIMHDFQVSRKFKVFSSKTGEWSVNQVTNSLLCQHRFYVPLLFYGGLIFAINQLGSKIVGFDVKGKLCSRIDLPGKSYLNDDLFFYRLGQSGGCLHYYCYDSNNKAYVWKLESGFWLLKSCFSVPFPMKTITDIKFHPIKDDVVFLQINGRLYSYNIKTTQMAELCTHILVDKYCLYSPFYLDFLCNGRKIDG